MELEPVCGIDRDRTVLEVAKGIGPVGSRSVSYRWGRRLSVVGEGTYKTWLMKGSSVRSSIMSVSDDCIERPQQQNERELCLCVRIQRELALRPARHSSGCLGRVRVCRRECLRKPDHTSAGVLGG